MSNALPSETAETATTLPANDNVRPECVECALPPTGAEGYCDAHRALHFPICAECGTEYEDVYGCGECLARLEGEDDDRGPYSDWYKTAAGY